MNIGQECIEIIKKKITREVNSRQYCDAIIGLNIRYPIKGHDPPLTDYQTKNYKNIKRIYTDPVSGLKYYDYTYPHNFDEAAQMYYWQTKREVEVLEEVSVLKEVEIDRKSMAAGEVNKPQEDDW